MLIVLGLLLVGIAAWYGLLGRGTARGVGFAVGILALVATVIVLVNNGDHIGAAIVIVAGLSARGRCGKGRQSPITRHFPRRQRRSAPSSSTTRNRGAARRRSSSSPKWPEERASSQSS